MDAVSKINFATLSEGLKQQRSVNSDQDAKIVKLEALVVELSGTVSILRQQVNMLLARAMGSGPTSKS